MNIKTAWLAVALLLPLSIAAQTAAVITMEKEPHHHLAFRNESVKVFKVEVSPGDSIVLHRHDKDTVAIAIGDQEVTVGIPGKPDVRQKNADAQVRLQRGGYVHSTHVDGKAPYHTVAVELMHPQTNLHNVCAAAIPDQPLDCPAPPENATANNTSQTLLESTETRVRLMRIASGENIILGGLQYSMLIVALDQADFAATSDKATDETLKPGDFLWIAGGGAARVFKNNGKNDVRFILFVFTSAAPVARLPMTPHKMHPPRTLSPQ
jgi:uncharacterized Zn-binding protein involved in type VI secretion